MMTGNSPLCPECYVPMDYKGADVYECPHCHRRELVVAVEFNNKAALYRTGEPYPVIARPTRTDNLLTFLRGMWPGWLLRWFKRDYDDRDDSASF